MTDTTAITTRGSCKKHISKRLIISGCLVAEITAFLRIFGFLQGLELEASESQREKGVKGGIFPPFPSAASPPALRKDSKTARLGGAEYAEGEFRVRRGRNFWAHGTRRVARTGGNFAFPEFFANFVARYAFYPWL